MIIDDNVEWIVVGAGLAGSAAARILAESGHIVHVVDRRNHVAGNMYDYVDSNGFLLHKYGPHTFHTDSDDLMGFMSRFESWVPYTLRCGTKIANKHVEMPFNFTSIDQLFDTEKAVQLKIKLITEYQHDTTIVEMMKSTDSDIRDYANYLFEHDFRLYTAKQWGIPAESVDPSVLKRVPIRMSYDNHYLGDKYEVMPKYGFTHCIETMLYHPNITVELNCNFTYNDACKCKDLNLNVIFTGPIDALFDYSNGRLPYRSLTFERHYLPNIDEYQPYAVEAYPEDPDMTRIVEYNKLTGKSTEPGVCYVAEYPCQADDMHEPYYPIQSSQSTELYQTYLTRLTTEFPNIKICGRLAMFRYMNMDQTLQTAIDCVSSVNK